MAKTFTTANSQFNANELSEFFLCVFFAIGNRKNHPINWSRCWKIDVIFKSLKLEFRSWVRLCDHFKSRKLKKMDNFGVKIKVLLQYYGKQEINKFQCHRKLLKLVKKKMVQQLCHHQFRLLSKLIFWYVCLKLTSFKKLTLYVAHPASSFVNFVELGMYRIITRIEWKGIYPFWTFWYERC